MTLSLGFAVILLSASCVGQPYRHFDEDFPPPPDEPFNEPDVPVTAPRSWQSRTWSNANKENVEQQTEIVCPVPPDDSQCQQRWSEKLVPPRSRDMSDPGTSHQQDGPDFGLPSFHRRLMPPPVIEHTTIIKDVSEVSDQSSDDANFSIEPRFGFLDEQDRKALLENCYNGRVNCRNQPDDMKNKKWVILQREMSIYQNDMVPSVGYGYGRGGSEYGRPAGLTMAEKRQSGVQKLKQSLLQAAGMSAKVKPLDDGTFQQDVLLTEQQSAAMISALEGGANVKRYKRASLFLEEMPNERWDLSMPIPFYLDASLEEYEKRMVRQALNTLQSSTCISFEERNTRPSSDFIYYVKVASPTFCGLSYIGKVKPLNPVYLSFACQDPVGVITHETMHSLGVLHQHLRADRDNYVRILWSNINPQLYDYFAIADPSKFTSYGVRYDYGSIMHYAPFTGALDVSKPAMVPKFERELNQPRMGQRKVLGTADVELLNNMYCKPECHDRNVYCGVWALKNFCVRPAQSNWMSRNCQKSCKLC